MEYQDIQDRIWQYSKYYSEMIDTSVRLNDLGESYAALLILFNTMELLFKSIRETDKSNLVDDINWLKDNKDECLYWGSYYLLRHRKEINNVGFGTIR